jgi:hypothetical protein
MKNNILENINQFVLNGNLPIAFYNSSIIEVPIYIKKQKKTSKIYMQKGLPNAESIQLISKIYDIF